MQSKLSLAFRSNLTRYVHDLYLYVYLCKSRPWCGLKFGGGDGRNDHRNYYKLSIGLGAMVERDSAAWNGKEEKEKEAGVVEEVKTGVAAGGIDQYVLGEKIRGRKIKVSTMHRFLTTDIAKFCDSLAAL